MPREWCKWCRESSDESEWVQVGERLIVRHVNFSFKKRAGVQSACYVDFAQPGTSGPRNGQKST
ncbi:MAG: hypothetical protein DMG70_20315 [Acidobacteria bacterium]|nr:MAG: hypothetical protein DMG70_20315 [Acidobacteriota bacterium]PYY08451.1 MAG: hypothetical protein DMG69_14540 [Acidobacteriota bacterium]